MFPVAVVYDSTVGKKAVMAVTGAVMIGWLFAHMLGNQLVYFGHEALDDYGHKIQALSWILWTMRIGMLTCIVLHVWSALSLIWQSRKARPIAYQGGIKGFNSSVAAKSMRWGGLVILLFLTWHLLDFTIGVHPQFVRGEVYNNLIRSFSNPGLAAFYIVAQLALGMHLFHGTWSMFHTLGLTGKNPEAIRAVATGTALLIPLGNILIPLSVLTGLVR